MNVYMIVLTGQGDTYAKIIDKDTWDWLFSPIGSEIPDITRKKLRDYRTNSFDSGTFSEDELEKVDETFGSFINDRALAIPSTVDGYQETYFSLADAISDVQKKGDTIDDTWEGYVY